MVTAKRLDPDVIAKRAEAGVKVVTVPENRWERVDIKTIGLLPNVLARQEAKEAGRQEAWFVDPDGTVKEGASTNAWIVTQDGVLVTRPAEHGILRGVTRTTMFDVASRLGLQDRGARTSRVDGSQAARARRSSPRQPAWSCRWSRSMATPVANGHPGSVALSLARGFF